jgi:hypothetical protein
MVSKFPWHADEAGRAHLWITGEGSLAKLTRLAPVQRSWQGPGLPHRKSAVIYLCQQHIRVSKKPANSGLPVTTKMAHLLCILTSGHQREQVSHIPLPPSAHLDHRWRARQGWFGVEGEGVRALLLDWLYNPHPNLNILSSHSSCLPLQQQSVPCHIKPISDTIDVLKCPYSFHVKEILVQLRPFFTTYFFTKKLQK